MTRARQALVVGAVLTLGLGALVLAWPPVDDATGSGSPTSQEPGPAPDPVAGNPEVGPDDHAAPPWPTTTAAPRPERSAPDPDEPPAPGREPGPATAPDGVDDEPVLLAVEASAPAHPARPSGGAAVARQRYLTIDAQATVDQLMGDRVEAVPGGYRREGRAVRLQLFDDEPIHLDPVARFVKESTGAPTTPALTTYSWMGTTTSGPTVTASLLVTEEPSGSFVLTGTITTAAGVPPLQLDRIDADRYALTELTTGIPCEPEAVGPPEDQPAPGTTTSTTVDPACAR